MCRCLGVATDETVNPDGCVFRFADIEDGRPEEKRKKEATLNRGAKIGGGGDTQFCAV
jgi:hypothetical protein